ncbi:hypothetical protein TrVFT333_005494 [Trichoderma virens FT-333]|nr:hypothetical protein TrVFT333_005494 [Trichoderma virens FT-333]
MAMIDVSRQRRSLLKDAAALDHLPSELLEIIKHQSSTKLFDAVSEAALTPSLTERIFVHFEDVFSDICARWILNAGNGSRRLLIASAIARILPFAPYLSTFLQCPGRPGEEAAQGPSLHLVLPTLDGVALKLDADALLQALLTYWRLFSFDLRTFSSLIPPEYLQSLFAHESRAVRYLAIRIFCQLFHASDHKLESLIEAHVGNADAITADFDGASVDYGFLSLHEQARAKRILALRQQVKRYDQESGDDCQPFLQSLTQHAVSYGKIVLPRPSVPTGGPSDLVMTATTTKNLERLAAMIRNPEPILLHGLPGVGKTALVHEMAKQLGMYSSMVKLHLNEQTDAKMLIGLYSTDSKPGSFSWRPGVLTTAIREGRWVLVEDLDRAPTEVLSTFLPLIERNELLIPSRGERIKAANSFRLFATVRTSMGMNGRENLPSIVGMRFWQSLYAEPMIQPELEEVVLQTHPILHKFLPGIIAVYSRLAQVNSGSRSFSRGRLMDRQMNLRDLLKCIGRVQLRKKKTVSRLQKSKRPFASTSHAKKLLEQIAVAVKLNEPVLLVGETGIGKTTVVQQLAESLGHKLMAVNLSQQSEVGDLLGGFKPVNVRSLAVPLKEEFEDLFSATGISASKNQKYLEQVGKCFAKGQWSRLSKLWREAPKMFLKIVSELERAHSEKAEARNGDDYQPTKKRKTQSKLQTLLELKPRWDQFARTLEQFDIQISGGSSSFAFSFVEGNLVKAVRNGDWVLLDEINLASPDTLESITDLLTGPNERPSILLSETGEIEKIVAHPNFRIFGAMNPATDIGKRDLPIGIRSRFTELYVKSPDKDLKDLLTIIKTYLGNGSNKNDQAGDDIARLYLNTKRMAEEKRLVDGANEVPHFSLRTLTRVLSYVNTIAPFYGIRRAMYEGFSMGFLTLLDRNSEKMLLPLIYHHLLDKHGNPQSLLSQPPKHPGDGRQYVKFQNQSRDRQYWLFQGEQAPIERDDYIITPYVERNLLNLVRATSTRRFPILIQGPTSAGKTSMIEYLANFTGNKFVRINNHEHTDLQEYLGTYISGPDGKLRFQEGLLVQAMRQGHWIVLDELNLAPTDVLEALNRLLDDNRELLIPETQEVVKPHENFILFATQNPPGLYGGRKVLSRAFRNRFLELHFDDIPEDELEYILQQRSRNTSPPDCRRIVNVYKELSRLRQTSRLFEQKDSFATLRDLFRWALRRADTREEIAAHGFMLLAERVRNEEERTAVKEVIEKVFKVTLNPQDLYSAELAPELKHIAHRANAQGVVWTHAIRRLGAIIEALDADVTEVLRHCNVDVSGSAADRLERYKSLDKAFLDGILEQTKERIALNETRSMALFEWSDGALVEAMRGGHFFLLDEISLADDSVLERLNSVLEPQRTLLLAEKGVDNSFVVGAEGYQFFATMNPGGDFESDDIYDITRTKLTEAAKSYAEAVVQFAAWFGTTFRPMATAPFSVREVLAWVQFINASADQDVVLSIVHGAAAIFIDSLGANPSAILATDLNAIHRQRVDYVPVEGEEAGNFAWRDAPFLQAMQKGEWVLLDEMNLASQSVLEGLNACLDHRGEVYISELDQVFKRHPNFRLFAAQNPHHQGGGRKGLPASFVNRFVVVYADVFKDDDLKLIASHSFPQLSAEVVGLLIQFVSQIEHHLLVEKTFGAQGSPWEFNLRDVLRWLNLLSSSDPLLKTRHVEDFLDIVIRQRFRTEADRSEVDKIFRRVISWQPRSRHFYHDLGSRFGQVGLALLDRNLNSQPERLPSIDIVPRLPELESIMLCVKQNIPCILSSPSGYGKSVLLKYVAALAGKPLVVFPMNADIDTMDLVGGFEQADPLREINATLRNLRDFLQDSVMSVVPAQAPSEVLQLLHQLDNYNGDSDNIAAIRTTIEALLQQIAAGSEVFVSLSRALEILHSPLVLSNPRFEWLDGVIVKALETGQWLVLDNANMCNASVLDRLNSLLEPNGFLSINEHCGPGGEPRIVKPHPEFRIFLTMDPRHGELSRAMRNRAIEIHIYTPPPTLDASLARMSHVESSLQRYLKSIEYSESLLSEGVDPEASQVSLENLSIQDVALLPRFGTQFIRAVRYYIDRTIALATKSDFDEAVFQAHLAQGTALLGKQTLAAKSDNNRQLSTYILGRLEDDFDGGFKLSTGLSMESLWNLMRPIPIPDKSVLDRSVELDRLGARFDNLRWKTGASVVDLSKAQQTLEQAYKIIRDGVLTTDGLVKDLITGIESLEKGIADEEAELLPFLANEFESLRQFDILRFVSPNVTLDSGFRDLSILSNVPTKAGLSLVSATKEAALLQSMDCLVHQDQFPWDGTFTPTLWSKLQAMGGVSLGSLALLDVELPAVGRHIASLSAEVAADPLPKLNDILQQLIFEVFGAHSASLKAAAIHAYLNAEEQVKAEGDKSVRLFDAFLRTIEPPHLQQVAEQHLIPAMASLLAKKNDDRHTYLSALAWTHFSVGVLKLYVPDRVFDPQLRPKMEREFFEELQNGISDKISSLIAFESKFTGQRTNERIEMLSQELSNMGPLPDEVQPVFRPEQSELTRLHAEFSNILKATTSPALRAALESSDNANSLVGREGLVLVKENVKRLQDRLTARFEAYQDMTRPAANLLQCLRVGLSLFDAAAASSLTSSTTQLLEMTPFFGGSTWDVTMQSSFDKNFEFLSLVRVAVNVEGSECFRPGIREVIFECFHGFYDDWSKKLEADRKAEETKGSIYQFRGSLEDEEEIDEQEFNELFPTYDADKETASPVNKKDAVRNMSLKVAEAHRKIFLDREDAQISIQKLSRDVGSRVANEAKGQPYLDRELNSRMLASTAILLDEKINGLQTAEKDKSYSFYTSPNLPEARQLVILIGKIKARFRELQLVDEIGHMQPLADVIQSCNNVLELIHEDPLAKILPKVEHLHAHVYEWQFGGWASKVYAVLSLYNALTDTIVRWRRLELSTWANLFETEQTKCQEDAYSWWFIAYQVVVAVPLSMVDSPAELQEYTVSLIQSLETYFLTSIVGQFATRLALLRQLQSHLQLLIQDYPNLTVIYHALTNFIFYYARYGKAAETAIQKGRASLDKKMKDVLLMASWKDTNINALRDSAKRSHQKLFRIVRKFRGILGAEMKTVIEAGIPDETTSQQAAVVGQVGEIDVPDAAVEALNGALPGWLEKHKRLGNVAKTVSVMQKIASSSEVTSSVPQSLDAYLSSLEESMAELKKETPSTLTDENKEQVKHMKTRKRKLFADTLRDLRGMGLRYNLGQDKLAEQESLSVVLASTAPLEFSDSGILSEAEYYFHKTLDLAPKARNAAREHSEDLTGSEVARSIGFVEGFIHFALSQRNSLASIMSAFKSLQKTIFKFQDLGKFQSLGGLSRSQGSTDLARFLPWTVQGLKFAIHLLGVHGKLGKIDHSALVQKLQTWLDTMENHAKRLGELAKLPALLTSDVHTKLHEDVTRDLVGLQSAVSEAIQINPGVGFILQQLRVWSHTTSEPLEASGHTMDLLGFAESVSTLCDTVLVAVENAKKAGAEIPRKEDEAAWLKKHSDAYLSMINQLYMKNIEKTVEQCIRALQKIDLGLPLASMAAMSAITVASPILNQFVALCEQSITGGLDIHRATIKIGYGMTKAFTQIASQGFCTPQEKSDEKSGAEGKLESGTGLGDGEGAEDISKDIQADEDLSELAQEANKEKTGEMEDEKDAVDMADEELEGDMNSVDGAEEEDEEKSQKGDEDEEEDAMDEEAGDVDDLDPTAVDEKMWDGDDEKAEKDQEGDKAKGQKQEDEQMATEGEAKPDDADQDQDQDQKPDGNEAEEPEDEEVGAEEEDVQAKEELNRQDQTVEENDALELPEDLDMNLDENDAEGSGDEDDLDLMSDIEEDKEQEEQPKDAEAVDDEEMDEAAKQQVEPETAVEDEVSEAEEIEENVGVDEIQEEVEPEQEEEKKEEEQAEESHPEQPPNKQEEAKADNDNAAPSDVKSSGIDQNADSMDMDDEFQAKAAQQDEGDMGDGAADQDTSAGNKGATSRSKEAVDKPEDGDAQEEARSNPFKKLGDALERWHRQQLDIKDANPEEDEKQHGPEAEEQGQREFQHLKDDEAAEDTQALGTADNEEAQPLDESMAIDEEQRDPTSHVMDADEDEKEDAELDKMDLTEPAEDDKDAGMNDADDNRTGVKTRQGAYNKEPTPEEEEEEDQKLKNEEEEEDVQDASAQLSTTHLWEEQRPLRDFSQCLEQWTELQTKSHSLSLSLTSQLRLILTPSQSTKLSGSFRTGKRLNIKRIIPYIASSYKRDKIWMRRSIPTKRTYQIMLCVDDSKSMGESSSGALAMESLVMVSRSLTMLEAGQVGVLGFGADVFTAHQLTDPFASDAGAKVLQRFSFGQDRTDIALLIRQTIDTFRAARQQSSGGSDLWQLALILSDGLTPSSAHDSIRRLLREAMEERIMIVFIIMDDTGKKKGDSVLELKEAKFVSEGGESRVVIERYLDTFPFQYYLIVHNLEELPSALAGLLRTWFAEVAS